MEYAKKSSCFLFKEIEPSTIYLWELYTTVYCGYINAVIPVCIVFQVFSDLQNRSN